MSRLLKYCEEKLAEAKASKERAIKLLGITKRAIKDGKPVGPMQIIRTEKDAEKIKGFVDKWDNEIKIWEAEKTSLINGLGD